MGDKIIAALFALFLSPDSALAERPTCAAKMLPDISASTQDPIPEGFQLMTVDQKLLAAYNRPSEARSREIVKAHLEAYLDALPELQADALKDLEHLADDTSYRLASAPPLEFLASLCDFRPELQSEVAVYKARGRWILTIGGLVPKMIGFNSSVGSPRALEVLRLDPELELHLHSHPRAHGENALFPSLPDLLAMAATQNGKAYIATYAGLIELKYSGELPGGAKLPNLDESMRAWALKNKPSGDLQQITKQYTQEAANTRLIPWTNKAEIKKLLHLIE